MTNRVITSRGKRGRLEDDERGSLIVVGKRRNPCILFLSYI